MPTDFSRIYSATYSNVPVYEFSVGNNHVMRRRSDNWINATHILKVADFDKPARTRILEREVQRGVHEKIQGGYGKYQGTWIPLPDGRALAERNGVLEKLLPIFDFVPGDRSPPPAPKHATASSNKPKAARQSAAARRAAAATSASQVTEDHYDDASAQMNMDETPDNVTIASESFMGEDEFSQFNASSRKRKRDHPDAMSMEDQQHQLWADELLDYFMLQGNDDGAYTAPPDPPPNVDLDRAIDEKGHTAMHWAAAMGDLDIVRDLMRKGAKIDVVSANGETPLMRAVMFTNNADKQSMGKLINILFPTVVLRDWYGATVFHHIAATTSSNNKYASARYYMDSILNKLSEHLSVEDIQKLLNIRDGAGDTAMLVAARNGARKCVRALLGRGAAPDLPNNDGETADDYIQNLNARLQKRRQASSSPFRMESHRANGILGYERSGLMLSDHYQHPSAHLEFSSPQRPRTQHHCEAAATLTQQIAPLILQKSAKLASAFDAELEEKTVELDEAQRVISSRRAELNLLRAQIEELESKDVDDKLDRREQAELEHLMREAEGLMELQQRRELEAFTQEALSKNAPTGLDGEDEHSQAVLLEKQRLFQDLKRLRQERCELVREVVRDQSMAGMSERQSDYKRLITGALGVKEEDVESMLPEMLAELEEDVTRSRVEVEVM